jgi:protein ImuB
LARTRVVAPALELSLLCDALLQAGLPNGELFATRRNEREGLTRLIERLQARLGADGCSG